jgi:hypothetical protein
MKEFLHLFVLAFIYLESIVRRGEKTFFDGNLQEKAWIQIDA